MEMQTRKQNSKQLSLDLPLRRAMNLGTKSLHLLLSQFPFLDETTLHLEMLVVQNRRMMRMLVVPLALEVVPTILLVSLEIHQLQEAVMTAQMITEVAARVKEPEEAALSQVKPVADQEIKRHLTPQLKRRRDALAHGANLLMKMMNSKTRLKLMYWLIGERKMLKKSRQLLR